MSIMVVTRESLDHAVKSNAVLVVELGSSANTLDTLAQLRPDLALARVDDADAPVIAAMFGVDAGPALVIFREQVVLYVERMAPAAERIVALVRQIETLDMAQVHAELEEEKRAEVALRMRRVCPTARRGPVPPRHR